MNRMVENIRYYHIITRIYLQLADNSESAIDCFGVVRVKRLQPVWDVGKDFSLFHVVTASDNYCTT